MYKKYFHFDSFCYIYIEQEVYFEQYLFVRRLPNDKRFTESPAAGTHQLDEICEKTWYVFNASTTGLVVGIVVPACSPLHFVFNASAAPPHDCPFLPAAAEMALSLCSL